MSNIFATLREINPALFKKLSWTRLDSSTQFYNDIEQSWIQDFTTALEKLKNVKVLNHGSASPNEFHMNLIYLTPESHLDFIHHFYIDGDIKNLFKDNMRHSSQNNISFHMSSVLPNSWNKGSENFKLSAHVLYEICPTGVKMHASTKDHKNSFDFYQWMLFLENTCSVSAYYDFQHKARHIQTIYKDYDSSVHARIVEESKRYPSFFTNRYDYNKEHSIIHKQGMTDYNGDIFTHIIKEQEFIDHLDFNNDPFSINLF